MPGATALLLDHPIQSIFGGQLAAIEKECPSPTGTIIGNQHDKVLSKPFLPLGYPCSWP